MNIKNLCCLVVGGDGLIGSKLVERLRAIGASVVATTRRTLSDNKRSVKVDLSSNSDISSWTYPNGGGLVFVCAGITSIAACDAEPQASRQVNVTNTLVLARKLYTSGARIVFLSSNAVFNGTVIRPEEDGAYCPSTEYGRQKVAVEQGLIALSGGASSVAIVRLSKVLTSTSGMTKDFIKRFTSHELCPAFDDLRISPVSLSYVLDGILAIAMSKHDGVFNLSGADEMTYADFARRLATHMGASQDLVRPFSSTDSGVKVLFRPEHPALGMKRTNGLLGITSEPTAHLLKQLAAGN